MLRLVVGEKQKKTVRRSSFDSASLHGTYRRRSLSDGENVLQSFFEPPRVPYPSYPTADAEMHRGLVQRVDSWHTDMAALAGQPGLPSSQVKQLHSEVGILKRALKDRDPSGGGGWTSILLWRLATATNLLLGLHVGFTRLMITVKRKTKAGNVAKQVSTCHAFV